MHKQSLGIYAFERAVFRDAPFMVGQAQAATNQNGELSQGLQQTRSYVTADATGLSAAMSEALAPLRRRDRGHDPGRVAVDLAVMLADGGETIADLAVLRNQPELFGSVASDATAWRVVYGVGPAALARIWAARAQARELAWAQESETPAHRPALTPRAGRRTRTKINDRLVTGLLQEQR